MLRRMTRLCAATGILSAVFATPHLLAADEKEKPTPAPTEANAQPVKPKVETKEEMKARLAKVAADAAANAADEAALLEQIDLLRRDVKEKFKQMRQQPNVVDAEKHVKARTATPPAHPGIAATSKVAKVQVGGLLQVWFQAINNDNRGIVTAAPGNLLGQVEGVPAAEPNELLDNNTFRVRRTELRVTADINEHITGYVMIDPSRENNVTFTPLPTFPNHNGIFDNPNLAAGRGNQAGNTIVPQLLQDAYINVHGLVPHHDFTIGQFKPPSGEEAWRNSGQLDFVDRAMVTAVNNVRDIGVMVHGTWFNERLEYWAGIFNGPSGTVLTDPELVEGGNRTDDNDGKDFAWRIAGKPLDSRDRWFGRMEMGYARTDGYRGEAGSIASPTASINQPITAIVRQSAWIWYRPNGAVKGMWMRGEWGSGHDHYDLYRGPTSLLGIGQSDPKPVTASGFYVSGGVRMANTNVAGALRRNGLASILADMEFAARYEQYENVASEDPFNPNRNSNLFSTKVLTLGLNYYIKGHDAKIQVNYNFVDDPKNSLRGIREVNNDVLVINCQLQF